MTESVWGKAVRLLHQYFPERQIYFRTRGSVRYFVLSTRVQAIGAVGLALFAVWVGIASANLILEDQIIAAKEREIAKLSSQYKALDTELSNLQKNVVATAKELEARQRYLNSLIARSGAPKIEPAGALKLERLNATSPGAEATPEPQKPAAKPKSDTVGQLHTPPLSETLLASATTRPGTPGERSENDPLADVARRLAWVDEAQQTVAALFLADARATFNELERKIEVTGLTGEKLLAAMDEPHRGQGGPFVLDTGDPVSFGAAKPGDVFFKLLNEVQKLQDLKSILTSLPVLKPVDQYYISSGFGRRRDPFNGRLAMHAALDMAGPWRSPVYSTAPGVVTKAGWNGPYGRFVEIDHGHGFKTRFGHLDKILVTKGEEIGARQKIGLMGKSGRATSTHVHYEVWFEGVPQDPMKFFKAAQYVTE